MVVYVGLMGFYGMYLLVVCNIAMENDHRNFVDYPINSMVIETTSSYVTNYQRVSVRTVIFHCERPWSIAIIMLTFQR